MGRTSQVLVKGVPPGVPESYRALARGRPSMKDKAQGQQYLNPYKARHTHSS
ncbi:hypothetical protein DL98DRAFT_514335 [Cadophora sp. DSE1049]|nr:hypothetical protein DL98DRAFT_514335 [Cadophora sp. DSE1049]